MFHFSIQSHDREKTKPLLLLSGCHALTVQLKKITTYISLILDSVCAATHNQVNDRQSLRPTLSTSIWRWKTNIRFVSLLFCRALLKPDNNDWSDLRQNSTIWRTVSSSQAWYGVLSKMIFFPRTIGSPTMFDSALSSISRMNLFLWSQCFSRGPTYKESRDTLWTQTVDPEWSGPFPDPRMLSNCVDYILLIQSRSWRHISILEKTAFQTSSDVYLKSNR